jgi:hypothetical protein
MGGTNHGPNTDPPNVAHDKKVRREKKHHGEEIAPDAVHAPQPGLKPALKHSDKPDDSDGNETAVADSMAG